MKVPRGVIITCLLTFATVSCVSALPELNSLNDLKEVLSNKSVPMHSLTLLHWFANNVDIDNNNVSRLSFDPNRDYNSHCHKNYGGLLPQTSKENQYCSIGNVNQPSGICPINQIFPEYVVCPRVREPANTGRNRGRIIVCVPEQNEGPRTVNQMYLTQYFRQEDNLGSGYDPNHTFRITPNLLQQLRLFSFSDNSQSLQKLRNQFNQNINNSQLNDIINIWGSDQAPLGLLYLIALPGKVHGSSECTVRRRISRSIETSESKRCEIQQINLRVILGSNGNAKIVWRNVSNYLVNNTVVAALFQDQHQVERDPSEIIYCSEGSYDTTVPLNEGLEVRLYNSREEYVYLDSAHGAMVQQSRYLTEEICRGNKIKSTHAVPVTGYAQLQLFAKDGKACFRLYVMKSCDPWKSDFYNSWVGLYLSAGKVTKAFLNDQWQWATKFTQGQDSGEYHTFEYCTSTTISPGLQARFMIDRGYKEKARTPMWRQPSY